MRREGCTLSTNNSGGTCRRGTEDIRWLIALRCKSAQVAAVDVQTLCGDAACGHRWRGTDGTAISSGSRMPTLALRFCQSSPILRNDRREADGTSPRRPAFVPPGRRR